MNKRGMTKEGGIHLMGAMQGMGMQDEGLVKRYTDFITERVLPHSLQMELEE